MSLPPHRTQAARRGFYAVEPRKHRGATSQATRHSCGTVESDDTSDSSEEDDTCCNCDDARPDLVIRPPSAKRWDVRRRDSRVNGADIYVARVIKNGMGTARPCWRCLEWCRWAGIKRVFHWNGEEGRFECVKVNESQNDPYETRADSRLASGLVR